MSWVGNWHGFREALRHVTLLDEWQGLTPLLEELCNVFLFIYKREMVTLRWRCLFVCCLFLFLYCCFDLHASCGKSFFPNTFRAQHKEALPFWHHSSFRPGTTTRPEETKQSVVCSELLVATTEPLLSVLGSWTKSWSHI